MINFWIVCGLLTFIACLFVFIPILRIVKRNDKGTNQSIGSEHSREKENVAIYKERLAELEFEKGANRISDALYQQRKQELEIALLNDVNEQDLAQIQASKINPAFTFKNIF